jgi:capsular polysaccharide export protein
LVLRENSNHLRIISKQAELKAKKIDRPLLFSDLPSFENILLLQGPVGPFFSNLRYFYKNRGSKVFKIHFNFGSKFFYKSDKYTYIFSDFEINFQFYIKNFLIKNKINVVFLFSNKRFFHSIAINEAEKLGIQIYSLEEGYMRPNYFTLEKKGNNLDSLIINIDPYKLSDETFNYKPLPYKNFLPMCFNATLYWFFSYIKNYEFPYYRHHRDLNFARGLNWVRGFFRFVKYEITEFFIRYKLKKKQKKNISYAFYRFLMIFKLLKIHIMKILKNI